jgi:hypothetical protein
MNTLPHSSVTEDVQKLRQEVKELKSDTMQDVAAIHHELAALRQETLANRSAIASMNLEVAKLQVELSGFLTSTKQMPHLRKPTAIKKRAGSKDLFKTEGNGEGSAFGFVPFVYIYRRMTYRTIAISSARSGYDTMSRKTRLQNTLSPLLFMKIVP